jgi:hypothetical protein
MDDLLTMGIDGPNGIAPNGIAEEFSVKYAARTISSH